MKHVHGSLVTIESTDPIRENSIRRRRSYIVVKASNRRELVRLLHDVTNEIENSTNLQKLEISAQKPVCMLLKRKLNGNPRV